MMQMYSVHTYVMGRLVIFDVKNECSSTENIHNITTANTNTTELSHLVVLVVWDANGIKVKNALKEKKFIT